MYDKNKQENNQLQSDSGTSRLRSTSYSTDKFFVSSNEKFLRAKIDAVDIIPLPWRQPIIDAYKRFMKRAYDDAEHVSTLEDVIFHSYKYKQIAKDYIDLFDTKDVILQFVLNFFVKHAVLTVRRAFDRYIDTNFQLNVGVLLQEAALKGHKAFIETTKAIKTAEQTIDRAVRRKFDMLREMGLVSRETINTPEDKKNGLVSVGMPEANAYIAPWVKQEDRDWIYIFYSKSIGFKPKSKEEKIEELTEIYTESKKRSSINIKEFWLEDGEGIKLTNQLKLSKITKNPNQLITDKFGKKRCKLCYDIAYQKEKEKTPNLDSKTWDSIWYIYPSIRPFLECSLHNEGRVEA